MRFVGNFACATRRFIGCTHQKELQAGQRRVAKTRNRFPKYIDLMAERVLRPADGPLPGCERTGTSLLFAAVESKG